MCLPYCRCQLGVSDKPKGRQEIYIIYTKYEQAKNKLLLNVTYLLNSVDVLLSENMLREIFP